MIKSSLIGYTFCFFLTLNDQSSILQAMIDHADMNRFALFLYSTLFPVFLLLFRVLSLASPRLQTFFKVRKGWYNKLKQQVPPYSPAPLRLWVHAASVGEFEQARPIIASLKKRDPELILFVSFLSDSGYNARKEFTDATAVFYLPADTGKNAKKLLSLLKPDVLLLMRYDFWPNHLLEAKRQGIQLILAAAVLQKHAPYFNPLLKGFYRNIFHLFDKIFTVSAKDTAAFREQFTCQQAESAGDPRFDQVLQRSKNVGAVDYLTPLFKNRRVVVAGSIWEQDEMRLLPAWSELEKPPSLVLVPHQVNPENMEPLYRELQTRQMPYRAVSELNNSFDPEKEILVIDQTGYLTELYSVASIAYVGGGFGVNVHNTLEPAVFGIPVLFGPRYHNSPEAEELVEAGGATVIHDSKELASALKILINDSTARQRAGKAAGTFVQERTGATTIISNYIANNLNRERHYTLELQ